MTNTTKVMPNWAKFEPVTSKPSPDVPVSRTCFGVDGGTGAPSAPNSDPTPQARAAPQAGAGGGESKAAASAAGPATTSEPTAPPTGITTTPKSAHTPAGLTRCSKCSGRIRWIDAYRSLRCSWCEPPLAVSQVREVWGDVGVDQCEVMAVDPDDLWAEPAPESPAIAPTSAEPSARLWTRLDVPNDVVGGLGLVVGVGPKWDGVWWCEVVGEVSEGGDTGEVTHRNVHHRLGAIEEFLHDRPT